MQDNGYRLIKLKNGDALITRILEIRKRTLILERPMQYKNVILLDQNTMTNTDMLVFKTWIDYSIDKIIEIPTDGVIAITKPDEKIILCYEMEKQKEDSPKTNQEQLPMQDITDEITRQKMNPNIPSDNINVTFNVPQEMAEEIIEMMAESKEWDMEDDELEEDLFPEVKPPKRKNKKKPSSTSKQPPKKNKKDPKEFGNDWNDWSPDPKDYI